MDSIDVFDINGVGTSMTGDRLDVGTATKQSNDALEGTRLGSLLRRRAHHNDLSVRAMDFAEALDDRRQKLPIPVRNDQGNVVIIVVPLSPSTLAMDNNTLGIAGW